MGLIYVLIATVDAFPSRPTTLRLNDRKGRWLWSLLVVCGAEFENEVMIPVVRHMVPVSSRPPRGFLAEFSLVYRSCGTCSYYGYSTNSRFVCGVVGIQ